MYSILLVDDELLVLETLRDYVDWKSLDCKVYTARNGKRAIEQIEEHAPDIIITDIQMPVMNGIELAKWVKETNQKSKLIFLTGYDDFDYIKEAFKVDAVDYILKPFSAEGIKEAVNKIKTILEKEKMVKDTIGVAKRKMLADICANINVSESMLCEFEELVGETREKINYGVACVYGHMDGVKHEQILSRLASIEHVIPIEGGLVFIVLSYINPKDFARRIQELLFEQYGKKYFATYAEAFVSLERLPLSYDQLKQVQNKVFYIKERVVKPLCKLVQREIQEKSHQKTSLISMIGILKNAIIEGNSDKAVEVIKAYLRTLIGWDRTDVIRQVETIYMLIDEQMTKTNIKEYETKEFDNFYQIKEELIAYIKRASDQYEDKREVPNYYVAEYVKRYVKENYMKTINIDEIADGVHLSPNYLRSIFRELEEVAVGEYITDYRFNKACGLLKERKYKVKEVSLMVGYENVSYFCSQFTKRYGKTPTEYRKMF